MFPIPPLLEYFSLRPNFLVTTETCKIPVQPMLFSLLPWELSQRRIRTAKCSGSQVKTVFKDGGSSSDCQHLKEGKTLVLSIGFGNVEVAAEMETEV